MVDANATPDDATAADNAGADDMTQLDALEGQVELQEAILFLAAEDGLALPAFPVMFAATDGGYSITATGADGAAYENEFTQDDVDAAMADDAPDDTAAEKPAAEKPAAPADAAVAQ